MLTTKLMTTQLLPPAGKEDTCHLKIPVGKWLCQQPVIKHLVAHKDKDLRQ